MVTSTVTVIIPTMCRVDRAAAIERAIVSVQRQAQIKAEILAVVNGNSYDSGLLKRIESLSGVRILLVSEAGISNARHHGRKNVGTDFFMFLDDDDELEPFAIESLVTTFRGLGPDIGVVIADATNTGTGSNYGFYPSPREIEDAPLVALLQKNWLILQSALFKTSVVGSDLFALDVRSNECTVLAFRICLAGIQLRVNPRSLAIIHSDPQTPSESKMEHFIVEEAAVLKYLLTLNSPHEVRNLLKSKISRAYHAISEYYLRRLQLRKAAHSHLCSLGYRGGLRYLGYSRKILFLAARKAFALENGREQDSRQV